MQKKILKILVFSIIAANLMLASFALASNTNGTIDAGYKYAWGENIGWINFGAENGNVRVTDTAITGHIWSANYGWINLNPATSGVANNNEGTLSGYGWGENLGWINFSGVTINTSGEFLGYATIERDNSRISFNCANTSSCANEDFKVRTDWRPRRVRPQCNNESDDDSDGRIDYPDDLGCASLEDDEESGPVAIITSPTSIKIIELPAAEDGGRDGAFRRRADTALRLEEMAEGEEGGEKQDGSRPDEATVTEDEIEASLPVSEDYGLSRRAKSDEAREAKPKKFSILEAIKKGLDLLLPDLLKDKEKLPIALKLLLPDFLKEKKEFQPTEIPIEQLVPKETPLALKDKWDLLPPAGIKSLVFSPLPKEFDNLARKFSSLNNTFNSIGISTLNDIKKLANAKLSIPGLTESIGVPPANIKGGKFSLPKDLPLVEFSPEIKEKIPENIIFAKSNNEFIDHKIDITITNRGLPKQKISTIAGKKMQFILKPEQKAKKIKGYVVVRRRKKVLMDDKNASLSRIARIFTPRPALAANDMQGAENVEQELVLIEFEYEDADEDGIYTAEIEMPVVEGEYELITIVEYEDLATEKKILRLTTVVDPEGYIYEQYGEKEIRVAGAIVYLYWMNPETKKYELWPAGEYNQENPQVVDKTAKYSFLVPRGMYYIKVEAPGYLDYAGKPFQVEEGGGIHQNIELKQKYWWIKMFDWKMALLILLAIMLLYNFYRDNKKI